MPTSPIRTYSNAMTLPLYDSQQARMQSVAIAPSLTIPRGTVMGELTATPGTFKPYASANTDGSQIPKGVLPYDVTTDASGNITLTATAGTVGDEFGTTQKTVGMYYTGTFATGDLVGLDANCLTANGWRLIEGVITAGVVRLP